MFSTLRTRFGIPGVISVIALVFAMFGGAYAASNSSSGGKATASAKVKKGPRGPKGAPGPAGPAGPAGPTGAKGDAGAAGSNGANGVGATTESFPGEAHGCKEGGVVVKSASPEAVVCNGKKGSTGLQGPAGPACPQGTCFLPSGSTETGVWGFNQGGVSGAIMTFPFNFPLPLETAPDVVFLAEGESTATGCPGQVNGVPQAEPGTLCVYTDALEEVTKEAFKHPATPAECGAFGCFEPGAGPNGTLLQAKCTASFCYAGGVWAVTAE